MEKKFSKIEIAVIKRTAQNVNQFVSKKEKINAKIAELEAEKAAIQPIIDSFQGPIKEMTGGYTTEDLVTRELIKTGKIDSKTGKEITQVRFTLKYPETIIPVVEMPASGNDYDADAEQVAREELPEEEMQAAAEAQIEAENAEVFNGDENGDPFFQ